MTTGQYPKLKAAQDPKVLKPGTVGVMSGELSRYALFSMALIKMLSYSGELVSHFDWLTGSNITGNCNELAARTQGDWMWIIGDDHAYLPDIIERLLLCDVDVVVPHCLQRSSPFPHVIYEGEDMDGIEGTHILHTDLPENELIEIYAAGSAGMLVKKHVLDAIGEANARECRPCKGKGCEVCEQRGWIPVYFETFGRQNEDLEFCRKIRDCGFKIHCHTGIPLGHIGQMIVWPHYLDDNERWGIRMNVGAEQNIFLRRFGPSGSLSPA